MGDSAAETVAEIEAVRDRLDGEVRELEGRLPAPALWGKRLVGLAVGGGAAASVFWFLMRRVRQARSPRPAAEPVEAVIRVLPDSVAEDLGRRVSQMMDDGSWRPWVTGAAGLWVLVRLAELRQLRRMNSALIGSRR